MVSYRCQLQGVIIVKLPQCKHVLAVMLGRKLEVSLVQPSTIDDLAKLYSQHYGADSNAMQL